MCVDFTDLNKAYFKDSYPLPCIDQLVDSIAGHKLLSFMDAFSGYRPREDILYHQSRLVLLQGNALRFEEHGGNLSKVG